MAKTKTREITITESKGAFSIFTKPFSPKEKFDFEGIHVLRQLLANEKARILHVVKYESPKSIYDLAKKLDRSFKSVSDDTKLLERFGFIELVPEVTKKRKRLKPVIAVDTMTIHFNI